MNENDVQISRFSDAQDQIAPGYWDIDAIWKGKRITPQRNEMFIPDLQSDYFISLLEEFPLK